MGTKDTKIYYARIVYLGFFKHNWKKYKTKRRKT